MAKMNAEKVLDIIRTLHKHQEACDGRIMRIILDLFKAGNLKHDSMEPMLSYDFLRNCSVGEGDHGLVDLFISNICVMYVDLKKCGSIDCETTGEMAEEAAELITRINRDKAVLDMFKIMALFVFCSLESFADEHAIESDSE